MSAEETQPIRLHRRIQVAWKDFRLILIGSLSLLLLIILSRWLGFLQPLRLALGLATILFVPGYCLAAALFPRNEDLDGIERFGLSLGLSIAWVPVLALILDALPWGLRLVPVVVGELASIALFCALALWRRSQLPAGEAFAPPLAWHPCAWWRSQTPADRRIYGFILVALTLVTLALAWTFLVPTSDQFMTEFYMLGPDGLAENFPHQAAVGQPIGVTLDLVNLERQAHTYRVEVWAVDPFTAGRKQLVQKDGPYTLARGGRREWPVTWQIPWSGDNQEVDLLLFDGNGASPYRTLKLFLDVAPK